VFLIKNIMLRNHKNLFFLLLAVWFLVNLIQAGYSEILSDEAYYGLYGRHLAWGYFDHPPLIALLTRISSVFFKGNLGIRFMTVVLQVFTLLITWKIIDEKHPDSRKVYTFFIFSGSICMFAIYGFITTPDAALLFFTALFLLSYKKFLGRQSWGNVLLLSVSMAGLVYSKYHGTLVIGLVVISNIRLLRSYKFWISGIVAILLFTPHIIWQIENGCPSLKYHLLDRSEGFKWRYILEYIPNQLAVFNPLILPAVVYTMIKVKAADIFTQALYFLIAGFLCFFGFTSLGGHVEPHWTISCSIAIIIILYNNSIVNDGMYRFLRIAIFPSLLIIILGRIFLATDNPLVRTFGFRGKEEKYRFIKSVAGDMPVIFLGSFQGPSLYWFFTGEESTAINSLLTRETQFDIWQFEKKLENKQVFICGKSKGMSQIYEKGKIRFYGFATDSLQTINRIGVKINGRQKSLHPGDSVSFTVILNNPYPYDIDFNHRKFPVELNMVLIKERELIMSPVVLDKEIGVIRQGEKIEREVKTRVPLLPEGRYSFGLCLNTILGSAINDSFSPVKLVTK
jgi:hypothetical protein